MLQCEMNKCKKCPFIIISSMLLFLVVLCFGVHSNASYERALFLEFPDTIENGTVANATLFNQFTPIPVRIQTNILVLVF